MRRASEWRLPVIAKPFRFDAIQTVVATALQARRDIAPGSPFRFETNGVSPGGVRAPRGASCLCQFSNGSMRLSASIRSASASSGQIDPGSTVRAEATRRIERGRVEHHGWEPRVSVVASA